MVSGSRSISDISAGCTAGCVLRLITCTHSLPPSPPLPSPLLPSLQGASQLQSLQPLQKDVMAALQNSYNTFVDLMELRDVTMELVTAMASNNIVLDIVSGGGGEGMGGEVV